MQLTLHSDILSQTQKTVCGHWVGTKEKHNEENVVRAWRLSQVVANKD